MLQVKALLLSACLSETSDIAGESPALIRPVAYLEHRYAV